MKRNIWDILGWVAFAIVVLYILLKVLGIIHSPITVDIVALLSGAYFVGRYAKKIDDTFRDVDDIKDNKQKLSNI